MTVRTPAATPPAAAPTEAEPADATFWQVQFGLLALIWGSSFLCIKVLGRHWPAVDVALGRIALGMLFLLAVLAVRRIALPRGRVWGHLAIMAILMNVVPFTAFAYGETKVSSVVAGLWNATVPLITLTITMTVLVEERPTRRKVAGALAGFAGIAVLLGLWRGLGSSELLGHLACFGAAICYGMGGPYARRHLSARTESGLSLAAAQLITGTAMLALLAPLAGAPDLDIPGDAVASLLVLGVFGSGVAYVLMYAIIRAAGAATFSTVAYVMPLVSTVLGVAVLDEGLEWNQPVGGAIVLASMWLSSRPPRARAAAPVSASSPPLAER